ncbi:MAG: hypothetical protein J7M24_05625, partial [Candidatus Latescibacteria bacterium]|nr:hypothetical protein [Candidatus Latescibacterota bacterium]
MYRRVISLSLCIALFFINITSTQYTYAQNSQRYTIAILDLDANGVSQTEAVITSDRLRHHITTIVTSPEYQSTLNNYQYSLIERAQIDRIFEQFDIQNTGCISDSCAIEFGQMLQADRIVLGRISKTRNTYSISARIIDVSSGEVISSSFQSFRGRFDFLLNKTVPMVGNELFGIKPKSSRKWYYVLGSAVLLGGTASVLLSQSDNNEPKSNIGKIIID